MAAFRICLMGSNQPLVAHLPYAEMDDLMEAVSRAKFVIGTMVEGDEDGICRRVMIATSRIQCAFDAD